MSLIGKKVVITAGRSQGNEGYVVYECQHAVAIEAHGWFGADGWYGRWYARKENIRLSVN